MNVKNLVTTFLIVSATTVLALANVIPWPGELTVLLVPEPARKNFVNFALFASHWLDTECGREGGCGGADRTGWGFEPRQKS